MSLSFYLHPLLLRPEGEDHLLREGHPVVLGYRKPFFAAPRPPLRLVANDLIDENVVGQTYVPA